MFDKEKYWRNRNDPEVKRGQGAPPIIVVGIDTTPPSSPRGLRRRLKAKDRDFTSPAHGRKFSVAAAIAAQYQRANVRRDRKADSAKAERVGQLNKE